MASVCMKEKFLFYKKKHAVVMCENTVSHPTKNTPRWKKWVAFLSIVCCFAMCLYTGTDNGKRSCLLSVVPGDAGIRMTQIQQIREQEAQEKHPVDVTAWREEMQCYVTEADGCRGAEVTLVTLCGSSEYFDFGGKILPLEDREGALIGQKTAEQIFGSRNVEHLTVRCGGRSYVIRGVLKQPQEILMVQESNPDALFDRMIVNTDSAEEFQNRHGLEQMICSRLRWDARALAEALLPGKWSDFHGWRRNFCALIQERERRNRLPGSVLYG